MSASSPVRTGVSTGVSAAPARAPAPPAAGAPAAPALNHIAIIPDGNRRWAAARGLPAWDGVRAGVKTDEATFEALRRRGIPWCTFWASSYDNLKERPVRDRGVLNELFTEGFARLADNETIHREHVRVRALGEWRDLLQSSAAESIEKVLRATEAYQGPVLTFLVGYDGDRELVAATKSLLQRASVERTSMQEMTIDDLRKNAWTRDLPEVDLIVRTGSWEDPHRSANFLLLLTSNVQEAYPKTYWPAFSEADLDAVIADYGQRGRRLGR